MTETEAAPRVADPLTALVHAHQAGVWRCLRALGCPPADADELTVEAFAVAHARGFVLRGHAEAATFLRRTARLLWLRQQRTHRRERARLLAASERLWQRHCAHDDGEAWLDALRVCLDHLGERDGRAARAVQLCYRDGIARDEVAARLGLKPNGLKTLLQRTRALLRACIERRMS